MKCEEDLEREIADAIDMAAMEERRLRNGPFYRGMEIGEVRALQFFLNFPQTPKDEFLYSEDLQTRGGTGRHY